MLFTTLVLSLLLPALPNANSGEFSEFEGATADIAINCESGYCCVELIYSEPEKPDEVYNACKEYDHSRFGENVLMRAITWVENGESFYYICENFETCDP